MNPNVDEVDIYSIRELPPAPMGDVTPEWLGTVTDPGPGDDAGTTYKATWQQITQIISGIIGSGIIEPDRVYVGGQPGPIDPATEEPVDVPVGGNTVVDTYLNGKPFTLFLQGVGPLIKGIQWDNDVPGGGWRLFNTTTINPDEVYTAHFHPVISNIISSPDSIGKFVAGVQLITSDTLITPDMFRKQMVFTGGYQATLPADYPENIICPFGVNSPNNRQSTILAPAGQSFAWNGGNVDRLWLGKNERAGLIRSGDTWYVAYDTMGYDKVGHIVPGRLPGANQIIAQGQTVLRSDYPRLLDYLIRLNAAAPGSVLSAEDWENDRTMWGFGDGLTTIQIPDLRGYAIRWLDMAAGIDIDRNSQGLGFKRGGLQLDALRAHSHRTIGDTTGPGANPDARVVGRKQNGPGGGLGLNAVNGWEFAANWPWTSVILYKADGSVLSAGADTRMMNTGELPLINL